MERESQLMENECVLNFYDASYAISRGFALKYMEEVNEHKILYIFEETEALLSCLNEKAADSQIEKFIQAQIKLKRMFTGFKRRKSYEKQLSKIENEHET